MSPVAQMEDPASQMDEVALDHGGRPDQFHLDRCTLSEIVRCASAIRRLDQAAQSMEEVSNAIVRLFFERCVNAETGEHDIALVRVFKCHAFGDLDERLQQTARSSFPDAPISDRTKCLVLLATAGIEPEWNDRGASQGHRVIPLVNERTVAGIPMISQLVKQMGLDISSLVRPETKPIAALDEYSFNVFHIPEALGSPYIPAQEQFVERYRIRSVVGCGGVMPTGNFFTLLIFSKVSIRRAAAEAFRAIAFCVKTALLPFECDAVFRDAGTGAVQRRRWDEVDRALALLSQFRSKAAALEELGKAYDTLVIRQSAHLERAVRELGAANLELHCEIEQRKHAEAEQERLHTQLVEISRSAGMAEIATSVLHNVGNVLNSVNVSTALINEQIRHSQLPQLRRAAKMLQEHESDLCRFFAEDSRGRHLPRFLASLADTIELKESYLQKELKSLIESVDHINSIISTQQAYASTMGVVETVSLRDIVDDAVKMYRKSLAQCDIAVIREDDTLPFVEIDRHKLMQIVLNLVRNARQAMQDCRPEDRRLTLKTMRVSEDRGAIVVSDTGVGIPAENLERIYSHGFTTKKESGGHGFGLHHCALIAEELGARLLAASDGPGHGATFTIELPLVHAAVMQAP